MTSSTLEDRLRSHYASVADRLVLSETDFDDVTLIPLRPAQAGSPRWRLVVAAAASIVVVAGLGFVALRPDHTVTPANTPAPPQTLAGETEEQGSQRGLDGMHDRARHHARHAGRGWWPPVLRSRRGHDNASSRRLPSSPHRGRIRRALSRVLSNPRITPWRSEEKIQHFIQQTCRYGATQGITTRTGKRTNTS